MRRMLWGNAQRTVPLPFQRASMPDNHVIDPSRSAWLYSFLEPTFCENPATGSPPSLAIFSLELTRVLAADGWAVVPTQGRESVLEHLPCGPYSVWVGDGPLRGKPGAWSRARMAAALEWVEGSGAPAPLPEHHTGKGSGERKRGREDKGASDAASSGAASHQPPPQQQQQQGECEQEAKEAKGEAADLPDAFGLLRMMYGEEAVEEVRHEAEAAARERAAASGGAPAALCAWCGAGSSSLLKCGGCGTARYCDKPCQVKHWKAGHKEACGAARRASGGGGGKR